MRSRNHLRKADKSFSSTERKLHMIEQVMPKPKAATARGSKTKKETFSFNDAEAQSVSLVGDFTDWEQNAIPLKKGKNGAWKATVSLEPGVYEYRFLVDGEW